MPTIMVICGPGTFRLGATCSGREAVHQLASDDSMMDWFCFLDVEGGQGGEALEPDLLARLGALPIALSLDFYTGGDDR